MLDVLAGGLFAFAFGGLLLIVVFGARGIEEELEDREAASGVRPFLRFGEPTALLFGRPRHEGSDDALLAKLEQDVIRPPVP